MKLFKLLSSLLDYPQDVLWAHREELLQACTDPALPPSRREALATFTVDLLDLEPMAAQERWLALFDRGRSMSLLLFEHIHGESRDRGQAMVDLIETYRRAGFELNSRELPDYLPLLLEFLSRRDAVEARDWLQHSGHILELLAARAAERNSPYGLIFEILVEIGLGKVELATMRRRVASEARDDTQEAMDAVWEEEAVRFGPEAPKDDCAPPSRLPSGARPAAVTPADLPGSSSRSVPHAPQGATAIR
ncbi:MAG: nitrate reductase molybdenum cofactor assembly chaperone [Xanthomonadales bacterium]|nr:nitrate reductase molybdenum cofactor assembly chaperone [Xanthomonadales bacterium]